MNIYEAFSFETPSTNAPSEPEVVIIDTSDASPIEASDTSDPDTLDFDALLAESTDLGTISETLDETLDETPEPSVEVAPEDQPREVPQGTKKAKEGTQIICACGDSLIPGSVATDEYVAAWRAEHAGHMGKLTLEEICREEGFTARAYGPQLDNAVILSDEVDALLCVRALRKRGVWLDRSGLIISR